MVKRKQKKISARRVNKASSRFSLRKLRFLLPVALLGACVYGAISSWCWLQDRQHLQIQTVTILGERVHVSEEDIRTVVTRYTRDNFVTLNVAQLQKTLIDKPWVAGVSVRKVWPDTLEVQVDEQQAVARWHEKGVLNAQGDFFFPDQSTVPTDLPVLTGPDDMAKIMLLTYHKFSEMLQPQQLKIHCIYVTERHAWQIQLSNGVIIKLGTSNCDKRLQRFVRVWPKLKEQRSKHISVVDLRYPNGMAVR